MRRVLVIATVDVVRLLRDRANLFFVFIFPLAIILVIGVQFGAGFEPRLGVYTAGGAGDLGDALVADLEANGEIEVVHLASPAEVSDAVARGTVEGGMVVPDGFTRSALGGQDPAEVGVVSDVGASPALASIIDGAVARQAIIASAARFAQDQGMSPDDAASGAELVAGATPGVDVTVSEVSVGGLTEEFQGLGRFDLGASQALILFVFLTSLTGSATLIQARQWGVTTRMLSTPTSTGQVLMGIAGGRFGVAMVQGLYIALGTLLLFGVDWGAPGAALAILVLFSLVSAGAAMLMGALFRNDAQAGGAGVMLGLGLAALGGCMVPIEIFPESMQTVALFTPHAWALQGFAELVRRDGGLLDILPELGVLAVFAAVTLTLATRLLHRATVAR
jgi:ABC-2 type transport system permease protein